MSAAKASSSSRAARMAADGRTQRPRRRRAKRERPAASAMPLRCLVLGIDTAANSGWAIGHGQDVYLAYGEADTLDEPSLDYIVQWAVRQAVVLGLPLVLVLEAPFGGGMRMLLGLGAARERWLAAWRRAGQPTSRAVFVQPAEWRAPVLGAYWARAPREEVRPHEQFVAGTIVGEAVRGDEAPAILVVRWAVRAAKVRRVLP
jgi:hypothetical protein